MGKKRAQEEVEEEEKIHPELLDVADRRRYTSLFLVTQKAGCSYGSEGTEAESMTWDRVHEDAPGKHETDLSE